MPYGMCGAIPEVWISIWVDQRKWVSRRQIDGHCTLKPMSRIVISPDELRRCWIKTDALGEPVEKYGEKCRFIPDSRLPQERDYIEYPRSLADRAEPGSIVIELGKENSLCRNMLIERRTRLNRAAWAVDVPAEAKRMAADRVRGQRGLFEYFTRNVLDIDNDGAQETVFGFHPSTHAHDADVYFVSPGEGFDRKWPDISDSLLWEQSPYVFPNAHARCERSPCGHADLDDLLPLHSHVESGHSFAYRLRYLHVDPLIWEGSTYFLLQSFDVYNEHVSAVLRPRKHLPPEETRIFRTVLDNY